MLNEQELQKLRGLVLNAQKPLFFFDNDVDGLASFLLLCRFCGKGMGVAIKSFPELKAVYVRKLHELKPDWVFVLDKPEIERGFLDALKELGMQLVWIDHHPIPSYAAQEGIHYFNPLAHNCSREPTAYICYSATKRKEDLWIAMLGCLADWYIPEFALEFAQAYPSLLPFKELPKDYYGIAKALYETELGKLVKMLNFALMDRTSAVVQCLKVLLKIKDPRELLELTSQTASIHKRFKQINRKYSKLIEKAKQIAARQKKLLFFQYGGELSISGQLANELSYLFPSHVVVVAYLKGTKANVSVRTRIKEPIDVRELLAKALQGIQATHGGHPEACGAALSVEDLPRFKDNLLKLLK